MNNQNRLQPRMNQKKVWNAARWEMSQPVFLWNEGGSDYGSKRNARSNRDASDSGGRI